MDRKDTHQNLYAIFITPFSPFRTGLQVFKSILKSHIVIFINRNLLQRIVIT